MRKANVKMNDAAEAIKNLKKKEDSLSEAIAASAAFYSDSHVAEESLIQSHQPQYTEDLKRTLYDLIDGFTYENFSQMYGDTMEDRMKGAGFRLPTTNPIDPFYGASCWIMSPTELLGMGVVVGNGQLDGEDINRKRFMAMKLSMGSSLLDEGMSYIQTGTSADPDEQVRLFTIRARQVVADMRGGSSSVMNLENYKAALDDMMKDDFISSQKIASVFQVLNLKPIDTDNAMVTYKQQDLKTDQEAVEFLRTLAAIIDAQSSIGLEVKLAHILEKKREGEAAERISYAEMLHVTEEMGKAKGHYDATLINLNQTAAEFNGLPHKMEDLIREMSGMMRSFSTNQIVTVEKGEDTIAWREFDLFIRSMILNIRIQKTTFSLGLRPLIPKENMKDLKDFLYDKVFHLKFDRMTDESELASWLELIPK